MKSFIVALSIVAAAPVAAQDGSAREAAERALDAAAAHVEEMVRAQAAADEATHQINLAAAEAFMQAYAEDLRSGNRAAIADRYHRDGAWRVGNGEKSFETWEQISADYADRWSPPASFEWRDLSFQPVGDDAVLVVGLFRWGSVGREPLTYSYTGLLVRQDDEWRIRLEDESGARP